LSTSKLPTVKNVEINIVDIAMDVDITNWHYLTYVILLGYHLTPTVCTQNLWIAVSPPPHGVAHHRC
jgi:hypothetical protein